MSVSFKVRCAQIPDPECQTETELVVPREDARTHSCIRGDGPLRRYVLLYVHLVFVFLVCRSLFHLRFFWPSDAPNLKQGAVCAEVLKISINVHTESHTHIHEDLDVRI